MKLKPQPVKKTHLNWNAALWCRFCWISAASKVSEHWKCCVDFALKLPKFAQHFHTFPPWHQFWTLSTRADLHSKRVNSALTLRGITHLVHSAHSPSRCVPMSQSRMRRKHHARCNSRITESCLQIGHWDLTIPQTSYWCKSTPKELVVETSSSTSSTSPSSPSSCSPRDLVWLELENR